MAEPARQMEDNFSPRPGAVSSAPARTAANLGAVNDNERTAANDNTVDEQRLEQRNIRNVEVTLGKGLKTTGTATQATGASVQATGMAAQATGKTMRVGGKALKATGKGADVGGTALMRAGAAMSATGLGAIVGVPTAILGAGVKVTGMAAEVSGAALDATGKAADKTGKAINKGGKAVRQTGSKVKNAGKELERNSSNNLVLRRNRGKAGSAPADNLAKAAKFIPGPAGKVAGHGAKAVELLWERRKVTRANVMINSIGFGLYPIHLALVFSSLGALGFSAILISISASIESASKAVLGSTITYYLGKAIETTASAFSAAFSKFFGFAPFAAFDPANWFIGLHYLVVIFGWAVLLAAVFIYLGNMVNPFTGKGAAWKMGSFIISAFAYLIPGLNFLPWFALYTACVWKNPE